jgi:DNA-binding transcriptional ArsR family regulator
MLMAFADPVRLRLLILLSGEREEVCVCQRYQALGIPQPTVCRHLSIRLERFEVTDAS